MNKYTEKQFSLMITIIFILAGAFITIAYIFQLGNNPISLNLLPYLIILCVIVPFIMFYRMTTTVTDAQIIIRYGIGWKAKTILISDIKSIEVRDRHRIIDGFGIRLVKGGMLYNISYSEEVKIELYSTPRLIHIGSKEPRRLLTEIEKRMAT